MAAAFTPATLGVIGQNGQNSLFMYTSVDLDTEIQADDYFLAAWKSFRVGDMILCNMDTDGTRETKIIYITAATATTVTTGFPTIA